MSNKLPFYVANNYSSESQKIRVVTECWVHRSIFCPNCGNSLSEFENNKPVADFYCNNCSEEYELKSKQGTMGKKIVDGAYSTMIERLIANNNPNFFLLTYEKTTHEVKDFLTIPKYFIVPDIIENRKPLSESARRAGWIGCNIAVDNIPDFGKIYYIQSGVAKNKKDVLNNWRRTSFIKNTQTIEAKGWLLDILFCVEKIKKKEFTLEEMYRYEPFLRSRHPANNNIQAKIRQQLQFLRDKNIIDFVGGGIYVMKAIGD